MRRNIFVFIIVICLFVFISVAANISPPAEVQQDKLIVNFDRSTLAVLALAPGIISDANAVGENLALNTVRIKESALSGVQSQITNDQLLDSNFFGVFPAVQSYNGNYIVQTANLNGNMKIAKFKNNAPALGINNEVEIILKYPFLTVNVKI